MDDNVDHTLIIGVLSKLLPFFINDKGEKSYGDREKLTDTKEKWRENRAVYFLSDNRFVRASITRRRNSTSVCEIGLTGLQQQDQLHIILYTTTKDMSVTCSIPSCTSRLQW